MIYAWDDNPTDAPVQAGWLFDRDRSETDARGTAVGYWIAYDARPHGMRSHFVEMPDGSTTTFCAPSNRCAECDPGTVLWSFYGPNAPRSSGWAETVAEARAEIEMLAGCLGDAFESRTPYVIDAEAVAPDDGPCLVCGAYDDAHDAGCAVEEATYEVRDSSGREGALHPDGSITWEATS
jgi:hypothetical protein